MAFELRRESPVASLGATYQEFIDPASGAKHIHLKTDSSENCFMASFPTVPHANDGRAHILEHLSLCGSKKFPTRDPFFAMTRRSLATFMNAMTYPDRTVYPFASQDRTDFFNLLEVYLDAAFFPNLERIDFLQEGWRLSFDEQGKLGYNGVVFNEMKEPMADPGRALWRGLQRALKPGTTYAFESGGDPLSIPDLTHEDLVAFHGTHYHPSRATFWSCGDIDPRDIQARIESEVIAKIGTRLDRVEPDSAPAPKAPADARISLPSHGDEAEHGFHLAWLIGEVARDYGKVNDWQIFEHAVSGDNASPLNLALQNAGFGRPASIMGFDSNSRQATFHIGMEGLTEQEVPKARALIEATLADIAQKGVPHDRLVSVLRDFELDSQEIRGGRTPHGLNSLLSMVDIELNGGDPLRVIDTAADLEKARSDIADPDFIKSMARHLLSSPAKILAHSVPDPKFSSEREAAEAAALEAAQAALTPEAAAQIRRESEELLARQRAKPDFGCLPKISPSDISRELPPTLPLEYTASASGPSFAFVEAATNGVGYFSTVIDASRVEAADWNWLKLGTSLATELGFGEFDYEQAELYRAQRGSGFGAGVEASTASAGAQSAMTLRVAFSAKGLEREAGTMAEALCGTMAAPRFDEHERIAFLIQSNYQETLQNLSQAGADLASQASSSAFGALGLYSEATRGIARLRFMERINELSKSPEGLAEIESNLSRVMAALAEAPRTASYIGSREGAQLAFAQAKAAFGACQGTQSPDAVEKPFAEAPARAAGASALHGPGQLNYCHASWAGPKLGEEGAGAMLVLGAFLRNTFLHRAVREEGGAYGGGASHSLGQGVFSMSSYRDPRLNATYEDFQSAVKAAVEGPIEQGDLEEAVISIMQSLDKPGTPREKAARSIARALGGNTPEQLLALRLSILDCSADDLRKAARAHLLGVEPNRAAYVCPKSAAEADQAGMSKIDVAPAAAPVPKSPKP